MKKVLDHYYKTRRQKNKLKRKLKKRDAFIDSQLDLQATLEKKGWSLEKALLAAAGDKVALVKENAKLTCENEAYQEQIEALTKKVAKLEEVAEAVQWTGQ